MQRNAMPAAGAFGRRFTSYTGLFFDDFAPDSAWIREEARLRLPPLNGVRALILRGEFRPHPLARGLEAASPGLAVSVDGRTAAKRTGLPAGAWELRVELPPKGETEGPAIGLRLLGVRFSNGLAWLGRVTGLSGLQRFRQQNKNRQLRLSTIATEDGEVVYDFSRRQAPFSREFARRHARLGMNIAGFLTADLGVGQSARYMVGAADAAGIPAALVQLKLHCRNRLGDDTYAARLREDNPYPVNVVHIDPPAARDIDHHHGPEFRGGKYNIGYFAWELTEFPDAWVPSFDYFDEIWCPSDFARASVAMKSPLPVLAMPHAIGFPRPEEPPAALRARFGLPRDAFIFLSVFDLNSYAARKNPQAAVAAYRRSGLRAPRAALVIKVQNAEANAAEFAALREAVADLSGVVLLSETLSRREVYALEAACDCFVSLHRSEGFGLAVAESMFLGKPAISTDWSATAEFVNSGNGCPVRCRVAPLESNHGPYGRGASWAEADPEHAAECMRLLAGDPSLAQRLGAAARRTMEEHYSPTVIGARYRERLEAIATF